MQLGMEARVALSPDQEVLAKIYVPQLTEYRANRGMAADELVIAELALEKATREFRAAVTSAGVMNARVEVLEELMRREGIPTD